MRTLTKAELHEQIYRHKMEAFRVRDGGPRQIYLLKIIDKLEEELTRRGRDEQLGGLKFE